MYTLIVNKEDCDVFNLGERVAVDIGDDTFMVGVISGIVRWDDEETFYTVRTPSTSMISTDMRVTADRLTRL